MGRRRRLTNSQVEQIREMLDNGMSIQELSTRLKVPEFTLYEIRRGLTYQSAGGPVVKDRTRRVLTPKIAKWIVKRKAEGYTVKELMKATKFGRTTVKKALRDARAQADQG